MSNYNTYNKFNSYLSNTYSNTGTNNNIIAQNQYSNRWPDINTLNKNTSIQAKQSTSYQEFSSFKDRYQFQQQNSNNPNSNFNQQRPINTVIQEQKYTSQPPQTQQSYQRPESQIQKPENSNNQNLIQNKLDLNPNSNFYNHRPIDKVIQEQKYTSQPPQNQQSYQRPDNQILKPVYTKYQSYIPSSDNINPSLQSQSSIFYKNKQSNLYTFNRISTNNNIPADSQINPISQVTNYPPQNNDTNKIQVLQDQTKIVPQQNNAQQRPRTFLDYQSYDRLKNQPQKLYATQIQQQGQQQNNFNTQQKHQTPQNTSNNNQNNSFLNTKFEQQEQSIIPQPEQNDTKNLIFQNDSKIPVTNNNQTEVNFQAQNYIQIDENIPQQFQQEPQIISNNTSNICDNNNTQDNVQQNQILNQNAQQQNNLIQEEGNKIVDTMNNPQNTAPQQINNFLDQEITIDFDFSIPDNSSSMPQSQLQPISNNYSPQQQKTDPGLISNISNNPVDQIDIQQQQLQQLIPQSVSISPQIQQIQLPQQQQLQPQIIQQIPQITDDLGDQDSPLLTKMYRKKKKNNNNNQNQNSQQSSSIDQQQQQQVKKYQDDEFVEEVIRDISNEYDLKQNLNFSVNISQKIVQLSSTQDQILPVVVSLKANEQSQAQYQNQQQQSQLPEQSLQKFRTPIDLICVIDTSGSMDGIKLKTVQETLQLLLEFLNDNDRICLISFESDADRLTPLTRCTESNKAQKIQTAINKLRAAGGTNISSGLKLALEVFDGRQCKQNRISGLFLLSDGQDSQDSSPINLLNQYVDDQSFVINSFGFGADHDSKLLNSISETRKGSFYYIPKSDDVAEIFGLAFGGLISVVATEVRININTKRPNITIDKTFSNMFKEIVKGVYYEIKIPQLMVGLSKDFVLALKFPKSDSEHPQMLDSFDNNNIHVLTIDLQLKSTSGEIISHTAQLSVTLLNENDNSQQINDQAINGEVMENYFRVFSAQTLEECKQLADQRKFQRGFDQIEEVKTQITSSRVVNQNKMKNLIDDLQQAQNALNPQNYNSNTEAILTSITSSHYNQSSRANNMDSYQNEQQTICAQTIKITRNKNRNRIIQDQSQDQSQQQQQIISVQQTQQDAFSQSQQQQTIQPQQLPQIIEDPKDAVDNSLSQVMDTNQNSQLDQQDQNSQSNSVIRRKPKKQPIIDNSQIQEPEVEEYDPYNVQGHSRVFKKQKNIIIQDPDQNQNNNQDSNQQAKDQQPFIIPMIDNSQVQQQPEEEEEKDDPSQFYCKPFIRKKKVIQNQINEDNNNAVNQINNLLNQQNNNQPPIIDNQQQSQEQEDGNEQLNCQPYRRKQKQVQNININQNNSSQNNIIANNQVDHQVNFQNQPQSTNNNNQNDVADNNQQQQYQNQLNDFDQHNNINLLQQSIIFNPGNIFKMKRIFQNSKQNEDLQQAEQQFKKVENYVVSDYLISRGAFSTLYQGYKEDDPSTQLAVKIYPIKNFVENFEMLDLIEETSNQLGIIQELSQQSGCVKIIDIKRTSNNLYIFSELCEQQDLQNILDDGVKFSEADALKIIKDLIEAFGEIYKSKHIIHREIKPSNILFNKNRTALINNFYSSIFNDVNTNYQFPQKCDQDSFYYSYQILTDQDYCQKTDVWSLGVILYQMVFGVLPFKGNNRKTLSSNMLQTLITFPATVFITDQFKQLLTQMLQLQEYNRISIEELQNNIIFQNL